MKTLVIAEKPSVARDIARVLGCSKKENGALAGNKYIVTWALGHLVTLKDPEDYDKKYKEYGSSADDAGKTADQGHSADGKTVPCGGDTACAEGRE